MGLQVKMGNAGKNLGDLANGESVEGYLLGLPESKYNFSIKLLLKDNKVETYYPKGNLIYLEQEIDDGNVLLNLYTKITRTGTRTSTKSRDPQTGEFRQVPVFQVAQDADDVVTNEQAADALAGDKSISTESAGEEGSRTNGSKFANRSRR